MQLTAVNGIAFGADAVKHAVEAAARTGPALEFLVKRGERYRTIAIKYRGGLRYPHLQRIPNTPARLDDILTARR
jgi:hypothetical protein